MKHTYTIIVAALLVFVLAIHASASSSVIYWPDNYTEQASFSFYGGSQLRKYYKVSNEVFTFSDLDGAVIYKEFSGDTLILGSTNYDDLGNGAIIVEGIFSGPAGTYTENAWGNEITVPESGTYFRYSENNQIQALRLPGSECDGTLCPATDTDRDNICDECGSPLAMTLRSTLLDYARSLAESKASDGYPYWAIFQGSNTYYVHISKTPMTSPNGDDLAGTGLMYNRVSQSADGVNGGSGWYNGFYQSYDEFVEANHSISNFRPAPPLAMVIQGVTEEQLNQTIPEVGQTITTILLCGVGCLALLILLHLLGKKSRIFHL